MTSPLAGGDTTAAEVLGQPNGFTAGGCNRGSGQPSTANLCAPGYVAVDSAGNLYVSDRNNSRVLEYDNPLTSDTIADHVLGQFGSFTTGLCNNTAGGTRPPVNMGSLCAPAGLALDAGDNLYVADAANSRVLQFATPITPASTDAAGVLGQMLFTTGTANLVDSRGFNLGRPYSVTNPGGLAIDHSISPNRLYVVDPANNRMLAWGDVNGFVTHAPADLVFGQASPFTGECNNGIRTPTADTLCGPRDVAVDGAGNVYVADTNNNRVLEYDTPFVKGTTAGRVFGQDGSFTTQPQNKGGLSADSMFLPDGVVVDATGALYVAEQGNSRVLIFKTPLLNATAGLVLGQGSSFTSGACNQGEAASAATLCKPQGMAVDAVWQPLCGRRRHNRVLEYNQPLVTGAAANRVFGQGDSFITTGCDQGGVSALFLCAPRQVALDGASDLYIADTANHRVLEYDAPLSSDTIPDRVFGQLGKFNRNSIYPPSPDSLDLPAGLALDGANNLYIADEGNNRVLEYLKPPAPTPTATPTPTPTQKPTPLPTAVAGTIYVANYENSTGFSPGSVTSISLAVKGTFHPSRR